MKAVFPLVRPLEGEGEDCFCAIFSIFPLADFLSTLSLYHLCLRTGCCKCKCSQIFPCWRHPSPLSASFPPFPSRSNPAGRGTHRKLGQCAAQLHFQLHVLSSNRFPPMQCLWRAYKICTGDKKWSDPFSSLNSFHGINSHHYLYMNLGKDILPHVHCLEERVHCPYITYMYYCEIDKFSVSPFQSIYLSS